MTLEINCYVLFFFLNVRLSAALLSSSESDEQYWEVLNKHFMNERTGGMLDLNWNHKLEIPMRRTAVLN